MPELHRGLGDPSGRTMVSPGKRLMEALPPHSALVLTQRDRHTALWGHADHKGWHAVPCHPGVLVRKLALSWGCV